MKTYYYPKTIKGIVIALTDMFNDLIVKRLDDSGDVAKSINVPIKFGPVNKFQQIIKETESGKKYYIPLPSLAIKLGAFTYAQNRARGVNEVRHLFDESVGLNSLDEFWTDVNPTPYDIEFVLDINTESMDDFSQILENILPYFNPTLSLRVKEFSFLNMERDLKVRLGSVTPDFLEEQEENNKRYVNGSISFNVEAFMYRPISNAKIIKEIQTRIYVNQHLSVSGSDVINTSAQDTSAYNLLTSQYNTSGFADTSAFEIVPTSSYDYSATFSGYNLLTSGDTSALTSAQNFN